MNTSLMRRSTLARPSRPSCPGRSRLQPVVAASSFLSAGASLAKACPYRTLGVGYDATEEEIRAAYRRKARALHPDVCKDPLAPITFMDCQSAYQTLLDPEQRAKYDRTLVPRANHQVLSYLNARSAARHGVSFTTPGAPTHVPSRGAPYANRPELYTTLGTLLQQVKSCAKHLEREVLGKDAHSRRSLSPGAAAHVTAVAARQPDFECNDHECAEPWIYYAVAQAEAEEAVAARRR